MFVLVQRRAIRTIFAVQGRLILSASAIHHISKHFSINREGLIDEDFSCPLPLFVCSLPLTRLLVLHVARMDEILLNEILPI